MSVEMTAIYIVWAVWALSWAAAAWWQRGVTGKAPGQWKYMVILFAGFFLLFRPWLHLRLWHLPSAGLWLCFALTVAGFLFCWWARIHLGGYWSSAVTRKEDHRIIDTGPYALVRHPIYTGIILASFAMAAAKGTSPALVGAALTVLGWYMKARLEERFLRQELGAQAYDSYAARTAMLVPFLF
jgi:protein-S-isoprenylcysteine O-methyltransferase Ste14